jgi:hypothetical protein
MNAPVSGAHVVTCARYLYPGCQETVTEVPGRDPGLAAAQAPPGAQAFTFYSQLWATARVGGLDVPMCSHPFGVSGRYDISRTS